MNKIMNNSTFINNNVKTQLFGQNNRLSLFIMIF